MLPWRATALCCFGSPWSTRRAFFSLAMPQRWSRSATGRSEASSTQMMRPLIRIRRQHDAARAERRECVPALAGKGDDATFLIEHFARRCLTVFEQHALALGGGKDLLRQSDTERALHRRDLQLGLLDHAH